MENQVINASAAATNMEAKRHEAVNEIMRGYGATKEYAAAITDSGLFPADWYAFEHNDKSEEAKPILAEGSKFRAELKAAGHSNPSVAWTRVRNEGRKLDEAWSNDGSNTSDAEGEGETAGAKEVRGLTLRLIEELTTLHKACKREEGKNNLDAKQSQAATHIASALKALGVDLGMVK